MCIRDRRRQWLSRDADPHHGVTDGDGTVLAGPARKIVFMAWPGMPGHDSGQLGRAAGELYPLHRPGFGGGSDGRDFRLHANWTLGFVLGVLVPAMAHGIAPSPGMESGSVHDDRDSDASAASLWTTGPGALRKVYSAVPPCIETGFGRPDYCRGLPRLHRPKDRRTNGCECSVARSDRKLPTRVASNPCQDNILNRRFYHLARNCSDDPFHPHYYGDAAATFYSGSEKKRAVEAGD